MIACPGSIFYAKDRGLVGGLVGGICRGLCAVWAGFENQKPPAGMYLQSG